MKTLSTRSATLAACTALLIAATAGQASADATDEPSRLVVVKGDNNNVAGNDLAVGDSNTSGTGHSIGQPSIGQPQDARSQATVNVFNCTGRTLTLADIGNNPVTNGEWLSPEATPPPRIFSHAATTDGNQCIAQGVSANWTSAASGTLLTSSAIYDVSGLTNEANVGFRVSAGASVPGQVSAACDRPGTGYTCAWTINSNTDRDSVTAVVNFVVVPGS